nr:P-loop NTPase fold protein [uncultured Carboxylicivirga sp.]
MKKTIDINNTFFPGHEIDDPKWFSGRKSDIERALQAISRKGNSIIVYGDRGVGKSSFIAMIKMIAEGNTYLIHEHKLHHKYNKDFFKYQTAEVTCDSGTENVEHVLQRLLTSPDGLKKIISTRVESIEKQTTDKLGLNFLKLLSISSGSSDKKIEKAISEQCVIETFTNVVLTIQNEILKKEEELLIIIDEFDQVADKGKLATIMKSLSKGKVKFLISGIATDYKELIEGHQSVNRLLYQGKIKLSPMTEKEVYTVFDLAEKNNHNLINFNTKFKDSVYQLTSGFPYLVQLCGQLALDNFAENLGYKTKGTVNTQHLNKGLEELVTYEPEMDELYYSIIGENKDREKVLKALASMIPQNIKRSSIYDYCENNGISNPKKIITYLLKYRIKDNENFDRVISNVGNDYIKFNDVVFKIFIRMRNPICEE